MRLRTSGWIILAVGCGAEPAATDTTTTQTSGSEGEGSDGTSGDSDASATTPSTTATTQTTADTGSDDTGTDDTGSDTTDDTGGPPPPTTTAACNGDGVCDRDADETCAACPDECGSCEIEDLPDQRDKYIDEACGEMGDGLVDECAASPGGPGRFNLLQPALESLVAGDTLRVHPGQYWREVPHSDSGAAYFVDGAQDGTAEQPIVVTAADRENLPEIFACNPDDEQQCAAPALAAYGDHVILDHLAIRGRAQIWGADNSTMQWLDCTIGWGACGDGNWSCLRIDASTRGHAHHNYVHDVEGDGIGGSCAPGQQAEQEDRGCGLKEFSSDGVVWEFNTVVAPPRWGYDLHRNSIRTTVRFNEFLDIHQGAVVSRTVNPRIYGNVFVGRDGGAESCIGVALLDENSPGEPHLADVHHNVCIAAQSGISIQWEVPAAVHDNVLHGLVGTSESPRNIELHTIDSSDRNAFDSNGNWRRETYEPSTYSESLEAWQAATSNDGASITAPGGACTFVDPPNDLHITDGPCATLGADGGPVGPYAITSCVGHACG
jgi:hypothetical protein